MAAQTRASDLAGVRGVHQRAELDVAARKRLVAAWLDPEVTARDLLTRFTAKDLEQVRHELGPKVRGSPGCLASGELRYNGQRRRRSA